MSLEIIPNEILSQILSHLPTFGSRYNCLLVSHRFHNLMKPLLYRTLTIPFIHTNRLVTLIRAVRRNPYLGEMTKSLSLAEGADDKKRNLERIIGSVDINKLFPNLRKVELYAMTFERTMLLRFFAYCARAKGLEEIVLHYPDLVPLMQKMDGLKRLTWSFTADDGSKVLRSDEGRAETLWIQNKWLESLVKCCPELEKLRVGCVGRYANMPIADRREAEYYVHERREVEGPFRFEKLRELEWCSSEGMTTALCWDRVPLQILEDHRDQLESVRWEFSKAKHMDLLFLEELPKYTGLKRLDLCFTPQTNAVFSVETLELVNPGFDITNIQSSVAELTTALSRWDPRGLREFRVRFALMASGCEAELMILRELQRAKNLKILEMTWGVPAADMFTITEKEDGEQGTQYWYHDDAKMANFIKSLPTTLERLKIDVDGKHDVIDKYNHEQYEANDIPLASWDETSREQVMEFLSRKVAVDKSLLFGRMPQLQDVFIGGHELVDGAAAVSSAVELLKVE
ncbi:hypothetical protein TWF694_011481 [Orbilia ellipsospora]|uniref:F-box domain-containing protein n=1 Tax=Orbilia ellipsospora TaxID=2528407 RepID=A0AAV9XBK4_9PEZI